MVRHRILIVCMGVVLTWMAAPQVASAGGCSSGKNIVQVADSAGSFNTLLAAAKAANLAGALQGDGPLTVFAPTDEAFDKLPEGTLEKLLNNPDQLRAILLYHVVPGR